MFQLPAPSSNTTLSIELQFRSAQPDGLLYAQERVVLYLSGGRVVLKLCQLPSACYELTTVGTYNSGWWCGIEVVMEIGGNVSLAVNGSETIVGVAPDLEVSTSVVYVGGVPAPTYGIVQRCVFFEMVSINIGLIFNPFFNLQLSFICWVHE